MPCRWRWSWAAVRREAIAVLVRQLELPEIDAEPLRDLGHLGAFGSEPSDDMSAYDLLVEEEAA